MNTEIDDDDILLPWWYSWWRVALLTAVFAGAIVSLIAISINGRAPGPSSVDVGFLQDMRSHHDQAVQMALIYRDTEVRDSLISTMSNEVLISQSQDIGVMIEILRGWGADEENSTGTGMTWMGHGMPLDQMTGMATSDQIDALVVAEGGEADRLFAELMTAHHQGGVEMAEYAAEHATTERVRDLAANIAKGQRAEIVEMADAVAALDD